MNRTLTLLTRQLVALVVMIAACDAAFADDPVGGASLFKSRCSSCHGSNPLTSNSNKIYNGRNARAVIDSSITSVGDMNSLRSAFPANGSAIADLAAYLGNSPGSLSFASASVGSTSAAQTITVAASLKAGNAIGALTVNTSGDFARSGGTCGTTVPVGTSCTVLVAFTPTASGTRSGALTIAHSATLTPINIALSGTGATTSTPTAALSASTLTLASTTLGNTSAPQTVTLSNTGTAPLVLGALSISGANPSDFSMSAATCVAGASVAPSSSCTVPVTFKPAAAGARSATLTISHNAANSPSTVTLSGTGLAAAAPAISMNASSLDFGSQLVGGSATSRSVTVTNSGSAALTFSAFTLSGAAASDYARSGTCATSAPLAAAGTCTIILSFSPGTTGTRPATLTVASNAANGSAVLALSGVGTASVQPALSLSTTTLAFGNQAVGTSSAASQLTLTNSGTAALTFGAIASSSADFTVDRTACGNGLAAGATCAIAVAYKPAALGAGTATLSIASNAPNSPSTIGLSGTGVSNSASLAWSPAATSLAFGDVAVGTGAPSQTLALTNSGGVAASLTAITLSGAAAGDFALGSGTCSAGSSLPAGATCTVVIAFVPTAAGTRGASLTVAADAGAPPVVALTGTGSAATQPTLGVAPNALAFTATATPSTLTLQNSGSAVLHVTSIAVDNVAFSMAAPASNGCATAPFDLTPGQSCVVDVTWTDPSGTDTSAKLTIGSNDPAGQKTVAIAAATSASATPVRGNVGAGGCSIARGTSAADPVLWCLVAIAALVLWRRR